MRERYYKLMHDGLRAADPEALIFSDRLPIYYSQDAVRAMAPYVDVIAVNYNLDGPDGWLARYFFDGLAALAGKPILISEFFCAAIENRSGNKNAGHLLTVRDPSREGDGRSAELFKISLAVLTSSARTGFNITTNLPEGGRMVRTLTWDWSIFMTNPTTN